MSEYAKIQEEDPAYRPGGLGGVAACVRSLYPTNEKSPTYFYPKNKAGVLISG